MQKKTSILLSLMVLAAMLLAACGTSSNNNQSETPGAAGTTVATSASGAAGAAGTAVAPGTPTVAMGTPTVGAANASGAAAATATTGTVNGTPTKAGVATATAAAAAGTPSANGTPGAVIPETGNANICQYNRLTKLTGMKVVDTANKEVGTVKDVVVVRDTSVFNTSMSSSANGNNASAQGQANGKGTAKGGNNASAQGQANGTGTAKNGNAAGTVVMSSGQAAAPMVNYVVVDLNKDNGGKTVLLPFQALKFTAAKAENKAAEVLNTPVATVAAGTATAQASNAANANTSNDCVASLSIQPSALGNLPAFDDSKVDFTAKNWDQPFRSAFANLGLSIPATGAESKYGAAVMLNDKVSDIHVKNGNNDDLGEVKDFILNPTTGQFSYAALGTGGFLGMGEKIVLIPMSAMNWVSNGKDDKNDMGYLSLNLTKEQVQAAPTVDNLDKVDFTASNWDKGSLSYWKGLGVSASPSQQVATPGAPPSK